MSPDDVYSVAEEIDYKVVKSYLRSRGWTGANTPRDDVAVFRRDGAEVVLPLDRTLTDYVPAMVMLARRVAAAEDRGVEAVLSDLTAARADRHRAALVGPDTLGLDAVARTVDGLTRVFLAAACSAVSPRSFHPRMTLAEAEAFLGATRFTAIERGSVVLVVDTPTEVSDTRNGFGRHVSETLLRSLSHLSMALRADVPQRVLEPTPTDPIVSANLCEAVLRMVPQDEAADLRFEVAWSAAVPSEGGAPTAVAFDREMYEGLESLATALRPSARTQAMPFIGWVSELRGAPGPWGMEGPVVITVVLEGGSMLRATADLDASDYAVAAVAHVSAAPVHFIAELHRIRRGHQLRAIRNLDIWHPDEEPEAPTSPPLSRTGSE
ncbi:MAG: hypothetical protein KF729_38945 [Sandaracinaceae bacterium]|nr:hypothetical protein [Sandaracinaceae bacterium]